jgi:hypothetical protein
VVKWRSKTWSFILGSIPKDKADSRCSVRGLAPTVFIVSTTPD